MREEITDSFTEETESLEQLVSPKLNEIYLLAVREGYDYCRSRILGLRRKEGEVELSADKIVVECLGVGIKKFMELYFDNINQIESEILEIKKHIN
jgi:hypothetical protein